MGITNRDSRGIALYCPESAHSAMIFLSFLYFYFFHNEAMTKSYTILESRCINAIRCRGCASFMWMSVFFIMKLR